MSALKQAHDAATKVTLEKEKARIIWRFATPQNKTDFSSAWMQALLQPEQNKALTRLNRLLWETHSPGMTSMDLNNRESQPGLNLYLYFHSSVNLDAAFALYNEALTEN